MDNNKVWIKTLVINGESISLEGQQLDMGFTLIQEYEHVAAHDVAVQFIGYNATKAIEGLPHVHCRLIQEVSCIWVKG